MIMKSKNVAATLAFFLGGLGAHKFYLGKTGIGIVYLLFCWTYIPSIMAFIEFIIFLTMSKEEFDKKYNKSNISKNIVDTPPIYEQPAYVSKQTLVESDMGVSDVLKVCTKCGTENDLDSLFCYKCGNRL